MPTLNDKKIALGLLIDCSSSMNVLHKQEMVDSLNGVIKEQTQNGEVSLYLGTFSNSYKLVKDGESGENVVISQDDIIPNGLTALLDGIKFFVNDVGSRLNDMEDRPGNVIIVILTDGEENASKNATRDEVSEIIKHQKEKYSWKFIFLAANQDAIMNGSSLGISSGASCDFHFSPNGMQNVLRTVSSAVTRTIIENTPDVCFEDVEREFSKCSDTPIS